MSAPQRGGNAKLSKSNAKFSKFFSAFVEGLNVDDYLRGSGELSTPLLSLFYIS